MRAYEILHEQSTTVEDYRSQISSWQELAQALPKLQTAVDQFQTNNRIYRGLSQVHRPVLFKRQMPPGTRASANTQNYYTLFIDNNERWDPFPDRSASIIATNSADIAREYGTAYLVLPEQDPRMGICARSDFWLGFPRLQQLDPGGYSINLQELNGALRQIMIEWLGKNIHRHSSWAQLKQDLEQIDQLNYYSWPNLPARSVQQDGWAKKLLSFHPGTTMEQKLDYLLDPQANGFQLTKLSTYQSNSPQEKEIWLSAPCWFIKLTSLPSNWQDGFDLEGFIRDNANQS